MTGLPLSFKLVWPFHNRTPARTSGCFTAISDWRNSEGLHAPVAVNFRLRYARSRRRLDAKDTEAPVINGCARKWTTAGGNS